MCPWTYASPVSLNVIESSTRPFILCYHLAISEHNSRLEVRAILLFLTGILVPLPLTPNPSVPTDKSNRFRAQSQSDNVGDSQSLLQLSAPQFTRWPGATLYYTFALRARVILIPPQTVFVGIQIFPLPKGFCSVCVNVCVHSLLCVTSLPFVAFQADKTNSLPLSPMHTCAKMIEMKERHLSTVPSELSLFSLNFQKGKHQSSLN